MAKLVSKVYGDALFADAMEKDQVSVRDEEVSALRTILSGQKEFLEILEHPQIPKEEKTELLKNVFSGRVSEEMLGFLVTVVEKGRQKEILAMFDHFTARVKEYKKIGVVTVTSAVPLSENQKRDVEKRLLETTPFLSLEVDYSVDQALIGGLVIRIGDRVADSSIRTRIEDLKRELLKLQLA